MKIAGFFVAIFLIVGTLIGVGLYFLLSQGREGYSFDPRPTTKTALCRAQYPNINSECIFEVPEAFQNCSTAALHCGHQQWNFTSDPTASGTKCELKRTNFEPSYVCLPLKTTDFADCNEEPKKHREWCKNEQCFPSNVSQKQWFPTQPFPHKHPTWTERKLNNLPCLHVPTNEKSAFDNLVESYIGNCGKGSCENHCNKSVCTQHPELVLHGFRAELFHCDLSQEESGARLTDCRDWPPMKAVRCHTCDKKKWKKALRKKRDFVGKVCNVINVNETEDGCCFKCARNPAKSSSFLTAHLAAITLMAAISTHHTASALWGRATFSIKVR